MNFYFSQKLSLEQENNKNNHQEAIFILFMDSGNALCSGIASASVVRVKMKAGCDLEPYISAGKVNTFW